MEQQCRSRWNRPVIWSRDGSYTFGEFYEQTIRYANYLIEKGVKPGDLVALYLINKPEFLFIWFGLVCIGAAPALMNYHLEGKVLIHCLSLPQSKLMVADNDDGCKDRLEKSRSEIEALGLEIVFLTDELRGEVSERPVQRPGDEWRSGIHGNSPFFLLYTR